jgi:hypothetical protein
MIGAIMLMAMQAAATPTVEVSSLAGECQTRVGGKQLRGSELLAAAQQWKTEGVANVKVHAYLDVNYRCIGGAIFTLQRAGLAADLISEPLPGSVRLFVKHGCAKLVDGRPVADKELQSLIRTWAKSQPPIHVGAELEPDLACVRQVLETLKRAGVRKVDFGGRETEEPTFLPPPMIVPSREN